jgi:hypothetical protein
VRPAPEALWRVGDQFLVLGRPDGHVITISGPGHDVWELVRQGLLLDDVVLRLSERYGADPTVVRKDVIALLTQLRSEGFVVGN